MFVENPVLHATIGVIVGLGSLGLWYTFRHWLPLVVGSLALMFAAGAVAISLWIDSPREQIERTVHGLAWAVQSNDANRVLDFVSPAAKQTRQEAQREMDATRFNICWVAKIHDIHIDESKSPPVAQVAMTIVVDVQESRYGPGRGRVQLWLDLVQEPDQRWRVSSYRYDVE